MFAVEAVLVLMAAGVFYILLCVWGVGDAKSGPAGMVRLQYIDGSNNTCQSCLLNTDVDISSYRGSFAYRKS